MMRYLGLALGAALVAGGAQAQTPTDTLRLTLNAAVERALAQSEEIRLAHARVAETNGQVRQAFSEALPHLNGTVTYTRQFASIYQNLGGGGSGGGSGGDTTFTNLFKNSPFGAANSWVFQLSASQMLFSGGKVGAGLAAAKLARKVAEYNRDQSAADIAFQVTQAYLDALYTRRLMEVAGSAVQEARDQLHQVRLLHQAGTRAEYDLLRAQVDAANQEPALVQAANNADIAMLDLKRLVNVPFEQPLELTTSLIPQDGTIPVVADEDLGESSSPALAAAETSVRVQQDLLKVAKGDRWPTLSVSSTFSEQAFPSQVLPFDARLLRNWNAVLTLSVPIFNGLRTEGNIAQYRAQLAEAEASRDQLREQNARDLVQAKAEMQRTQVLLLARGATVDQASQARHIAQVRYTNGLATQLEVADARLLLEQAQVNQAQAMRDYLTSIAQLERALGRPVKVEQRSIEQVRQTISGEEFHP
jgi:outer membrane protein TolC